MNIGKLCSIPAITIPTSAPLSQAAQLMVNEHIGALVVIKSPLDQPVAVGMLTDRDIVTRAVAKGKDPRGMPVREVATKDVVTVHPDEDLSEALKLMAAHQVRRLPVVDDDNRLVGVVSQADVALQAKEKSVGEMVEEISKPPAGPRL